MALTWFPTGRSPRVSGVRWLAMLLGVLVLVTLLAAGPLSRVDRVLDYPWAGHNPGLRPVFEVLVRLGQRAFCVPVLLIVAALSAHRRRTWQPFLLAVGALLVLNLLVGVVKIVTARGDPLSGDPAFFQEGVMYPSGHAANAVLVYGLAAVIARRTWGPRSVTAVALVVLTVLTSVLMLVTGLYLRWHWFSDLVAGFLTGGLVLQAAVLYGGMTGPGRSGSASTRA